MTLPNDEEQQKKLADAIDRYRADPRVFEDFFVKKALKPLSSIREKNIAALADVNNRFAQAEGLLDKLAEKFAGIAERESELRSGENYGAEFDALASNPKIADIQMLPSKLVVITSELCVPYGGRKYWIAPLKIELNLEGKFAPNGGPDDYSVIRVWKSHPSQKVSPFGFPNEGPDWPAPHVRGNGSLCLGNIKNMVEKAYRLNHWTTVIELLIPFLESCNVNDRDYYFNVLKNVAIRVE